MREDCLCAFVESDGCHSQIEGSNFEMSCEVMFDLKISTDPCFGVAPKLK